MEQRERGSSVGAIATSKYAVPRRRQDVVRRPRLNAILDAAIGGRGVVIAAPAGYGKTTLVVDWLQTADVARVWLSLDAWDASLPAFTRALAGAISAHFGVELALGDERFWQPRTVSTVICNALAAQEDYVVLVLDDLHTIESAGDVMEMLGYLLERAPENLSLVVTSRTRPPLPSLSRLIARREVTTVGAADLAFTPREVRELLASLGRAISEDEAETLFERTEGWAAALILGAATTSPVSGRDEVAGESEAGGTGSIAGPNVGLSLADYVQGESLETVPEDLRDFLRSISLLPVWTPALCNDVTRRTDCERLLKEVARRVLFVSQHTDEPPSYRCHQLMRTLLMQQFRREDPERFAAAGRDAAETLARFGMLNEAVELLFELEEWDQAADVLEDIAPRLIQQGQSRALAEWIDRLPLQSRTQRPQLQVWRARAAYKLQNADEALRLIEDALTSLRQAGDVPGIAKALFVRGETQRLKGYYEEALDSFREARNLLEAWEQEDARLTGESLRNIGITNTITGNLDAAVEELEQARRLLEQVGELEGIGSTCTSLAQCYSMRGEPLAALGALQRAQSAFERAGSAYDLGLAINNTGMLYYELGEYEQALQVYERGIRVTRGAGNGQQEAFMMAGVAETYRNMGRFDDSLAAYQEVEAPIRALQIPELVVEFTEGLALTRLRLGQGEEAARLLSTVEPKRTDSHARFVAHRLVQSQVALARGDHPGALKFLDDALHRLDITGNRNAVAVARFLRAIALFGSQQPRKALSELEEADSTCQQLGYCRFLRPYLADARDLLDYARVRNVATWLNDELLPVEETARAEKLAEEAAASGMLPPVRAFALGRGSVMVGERQISDAEWRSEKSKEMFFFLLWKREPVTKEEIFTALWPELPESKCNSNFHSSLYRLRRALFHECVVRTPDGGYELNPRGTFAWDVEDFNQAMLEADVARSPEERVAKLEQAVACYKGGFLSSTYSEWAQPLRRELEERYIEAVNELAASKLREGRFEEALVLFRSLAALDPYSEAAAVGIMRCHLGLNDPSAAARHFRRFREVLKDELDEDPPPRLLELYQKASGKA